MPNYCASPRLCIRSERGRDHEVDARGVRTRSGDLLSGGGVAGADVLAPGSQGVPVESDDEVDHGGDGTAAAPARNRGNHGSLEKCRVGSRLSGRRAAAGVAAMRQPSPILLAALSLVVAAPAHAAVTRSTVTSPAGP